MNKEIWKDIPEFENYYKISNFGRIKSKKTNKNNQYSKKEILRKYSDDGDGYFQVVLYKPGVRKSYKVHKLVAITFLNKSSFKYMPNENLKEIDLNKLEVNHKDENKQNNHANNLEWCTKQYNCNYGKRNNKVKHCKKIIQYDLQNKFIKKWNCISDASKFLNISFSNISSCLRKITKQAGGYHWEYFKEDK